MVTAQTVLATEPDRYQSGQTAAVDEQPLPPVERNRRRAKV